MSLSVIQRNSLLLSVGLLSFSMLGFEIALTNLFGVLFQYHYVSLVISLSLFGIGVGGLASRRLRNVRLAGLGWTSASAGVALCVVGVFFANFPYVNQLFWYIAAGMLPFFLFGLVIGQVFYLLKDSTALVYASDLLGAGLGALIAYMLLNRVGALLTIHVIGLVPLFAAALLFGISGKANGQRQRERNGIKPKLFAACMLLGIVLLGMMPRWIGSGLWTLDFASMKGAPQDKTLIGTLQSDPKARIVRTEWDAFARTDVVETSSSDTKLMFVNAGAGSYMYRLDQGLSGVESLKYDIEFLPFILGSADRTMIVGAGGGRDILYTLLSGGKKITAVELSPGLVTNMRALSPFNGSLLDRPEVRTIVGDGRTVIEQSTDRYDLIVLNLVYSQVAGLRSNSLSENYIFTLQAFREYYRHLNPDGRIIIISHHGIEGTRGFYTGMKAVMEEDQADPAQAAAHMSLLMGSENSKSPRLTISIIKRSPLTTDEKNTLATAVKALKLTPLFIPGTEERLLKPLLSGSMSFDRFVKDGDYDVYPTTDDRPFFFQNEKGIPASLLQWLASIVVLTIAAAAVFAVSRKSGGANIAVIKKRNILYYTALGIGYMCIQLPLIQKFLLLLGSPVLTAAIVLIAMLLGSGAGSLAVHRLRISLLAAVCCIAFLSIAYMTVVSYASSPILTLEFPVRAILVAGATFVLGFFLGIPFPLALKSEQKADAGTATIYFAFNGIASVWGAWTATIVAMSGGFTLTISLGILLYLLLLFNRRRVTAWN